MSNSPNNPQGTPTGTGSATIEQGGAGQETAKEPASGSDEQSYLLNYASKEDAEKGYKEIQALATRASQEKADLEREVELLRQKGEIDSLKQSVNSVAEREALEAQRNHEEAYARQMESLKERVADEGAEVLVEEFNTALFQQKQQIQEQLKSQQDLIKSLKDELSGQLGQTKLELSSEYQRLKPLMDELKGKPAFASATPEQLMAVANEVKGYMPEEELAPMPPGMGGSRAGIPAPEEPKGLSEDMKAVLKAKGLLSDDQIASAERRLKGKG